MFASTPSTELKTERRLVLREVGEILKGSTVVKILSKPASQDEGGKGKGRMCRQCNRVVWEKKLSDEVRWGRGSLSEALQQANLPLDY